MKLTTRLALLFFILSFLPVAAVGYLTYSNGRQAIEDNLSTHLMATTLYKQDEFQRWINNNGDKITNLAQRPLVREYTATFLMSETGSVDAQNTYQILLNDHLLPNLKDNNYRSFTIIEPNNGEIVLSTEKRMEGKFRETEPYFLEGQQSLFTDNVRYFISEDEIGMHVSTPILDRNGKLIAVLVGETNLDVMTEIMQQGKEILQNEETYIVNPAYFFVTEPWLGEAAALQNTARTEGVTACLEGHSGTKFYRDYRDVEVIGAYRWMAERNLCILTELDQNQALEPILALRDKIYLLGTLSAILMAVFGFYNARNITNPIEKLVEGANQIEKGDLAFQIDSSRKDELGQLATAFNSMSENLARTKAENDILYQETRSLADNLEKRVEERTTELGLSEERYRILAETSPDMIFVIDENERVQYVNDRAARQFGKTPEQVTGKAHTKLFPPAIAENQGLSLQQVFSTGQPLSSESPVAFPDGEIWLDTKLVPVLNEEGKVQAVMGVSRDITDRKETAQIIQEEKALSDSIINSLPGIFYLFDADGKFLRWNKNFERVSGYSPEEMLERNPLEFFVDEDKALVQQAIQETFVEGVSQVEANFTSRKGIGTPYLLTGVRVEIKHQVYLIGAGIDISERKQAEEMLRSSEEKFRRMSDTSPLAIFQSVGIEQKAIYVNDTFTKLFGYTKEEVQSAAEWWPKAYPDENYRQQVSEEWQRKVEHALETQSEIEPMDVVVTCKDGSQKNIIWGYVSFEDQNWAFGLNLTEQKMAEEKLIKAMHDLKDSNHELERFAYVASHDLQEPLRMVTSYLQLLERRYKEKLDGDAIEFINYAVDGSNRMKILINDLLAYSRVGSRGKEFVLTNIDTVFSHVIDNLQESIKESNTKISHDPLPKVLGDDVQLVSLFQNLIGNAIKFRSKKTPKIHIGVKQKDSEWIFSVSDNGIGIDPQYFDRIFIIFQRLHNREEFSGTGIGLAVSKRIVERHGGRIWVESQDGAGSTFYFSIPVIGENNDTNPR